jgi:3D (Asp-Asp-Asp) domain-containing protein
MIKFITVLLLTFGIFFNVQAADLKMDIEVTAYNVGDVAQTDDEPCIDASNTDICKALDKGERRCAANFIPLGTFIYIEGYGDCVVTDRMNRRYQKHVDIAMKKHEKRKALDFGRRTLFIFILVFRP